MIHSVRVAVHDVVHALGGIFVAFDENGEALHEFNHGHQFLIVSTPSYSIRIEHQKTFNQLLTDLLLLSEVLKDDLNSLFEV